jgi:hypothetical protein
VAGVPCWQARGRQTTKRALGLCADPRIGAWPRVNEQGAQMAHCVVIKGLSHTPAQNQMRRLQSIAGCSASGRPAGRPGPRSHLLVLHEGPEADRRGAHGGGGEARRTGRWSAVMSGRVLGTVWCSRARTAALAPRSAGTGGPGMERPDRHRRTNGFEPRISTEDLERRCRDLVRGARVVMAANSLAAAVRRSDPQVAGGSE